MSMAYGATFDVYVSPMSFVDRATNEKIIISHEADASLYYSSMYASSAKMSNGRGGYERVEKPRVFGEDTIKYAYPDCNYRRNPLDCSVQNGHYYVETIVTFNDDQMIMRAILFNPQGIIIHTSSRTDEMIVNWIKQQEVTIIESEGKGGKQTLTHYGKEDLPLKWEIPYKLLQTHVRQAVLGLWVGVKID
jgi:hypothetical protein